jgi:putative polyhydroxyalkanoate system protein
MGGFDGRPGRHRRSGVGDVAPTGPRYPRLVRASRRRCDGGGGQCCGREDRRAATSRSLCAEDTKTQWTGVSVEAVSDIVVRRRHELDIAGARRLAETVARRLRDDFGGSYAWDGDTLHFRRTGISGQLAVTPETVEVRVSIGLLLTPLHARIEREIVAFCDDHLDHDRLQPARPAAARSGATRSSRSHGASRSARPK